MDGLFPEPNIDFYTEPGSQTGFEVVSGNYTCTQDMILGYSTSDSESNVSRRRKRTKWETEEDAILLDAINQQPQDKKNWTVVAAKVNKDSSYVPRTGKQCRERWHNHLRPDIKKGKWTTQEEELIQTMFEAYGPKWSCMSKHMKTRTENDIKNKWYSMQRAKKNRKRKTAEQKAEKRSMKTMLNKRQEIPDLIPSSKRGLGNPVFFQDENQVNALNTAHGFDGLQPYPPLHQGSFDTSEVSEFFAGMFSTNRLEV